jgi:hypothetical protein
MHRGPSAVGLHVFDDCVLQAGAVSQQTMLCAPHSVHVPATQYDPTQPNVLAFMRSHEPAPLPQHG